MYLFELEELKIEDILASASKSSYLFIKVVLGMWMEKLKGNTKRINHFMQSQILQEYYLICHA